jgi:putative ABC transport system substrate-binding protein
MSVGKKVIGVALGALLLAVSFPAEAQQPKIPRIGWMALYGSSSARESMDELRKRGYVEGQSIIIEYRSARGREQRLPEIAAEIVRLNPDVIIAEGNAATLAAREATTTIPIVFMHGDPVRDGVINSLARPGSNLTGVSSFSFELARKRLDLLRDAFPKTSRVAVLLSADTDVHRRQFAEMQKIAQTLGMQLEALEFLNEMLNFDSVFQQAISHHANALLVLQSPAFTAHRMRLVDFAAKNRLPAIYPRRAFADAGGLMSYGPDPSQLYRRAAVYVEKILKGTKPADLPVEQPTRFELVINLKTARQIGVTVPTDMLMWAEHVIK